MKIDQLANRDAIVTAILSGQSLRQVGKMAGISHTAVGNYVRQVIRPALQSSSKAVHMQRMLPESADAIQTVRAVANVAREASNTAALSPVLQRLAQRQIMQAELMEAARADRDYRGFAACDASEFRDIQLTCRLLGLLEGPGNANVNVQTNTVWLMPAIPSIPGSGSNVIDVLPE